MAPIGPFPRPAEQIPEYRIRPRAKCSGVSEVHENRDPSAVTRSAASSTSRAINNRRLTKLAINADQDQEGMSPTGIESSPVSKRKGGCSHLAVYGLSDRWRSARRMRDT